MQHGSRFVVRTDTAEFHAPALVVATGGLSIPKIGATSFGYELARQFGIKIRECRPALVPLTFNAEDRKSYCDLAGVSTEVIAAIGRQQFREKMLITHRGLSGPAILQISSYWNGREPIAIDLAPEQQITASLRASNARRDLAAAKSALHGALPIRLAERWLELHPPARWTNAALDEMESVASSLGSVAQLEPKATRKPRSQPAASTPMNSQPKLWSAAKFPVCTSSAKWWT